MDRLEFPIRGRKLALVTEVTSHVAACTSPYQQIDVFDTPALGRILTLDGHIQLSTLDEHAYHEALVQVPLLSIGEPRSALVIGGGDGGAMREILRHSSIERASMFELDQQVTDLCRTYLPSVSGGAFNDPRTSVSFGDALQLLPQCDQTFDLIVLDATDVYEGEDGSISHGLFLREFYAQCHRVLSTRGMLVTQADNFVFCPYSAEAALAELGSVFERTGVYRGLVPSFGGFSAYCWASNGAEPLSEMPSSGLALRYLNPATWQLAFAEWGF